MGDDKLYDEETNVTAKNGAVILDGPDGVDVKVTPEAAEQTAENLIDGAISTAAQALSTSRSGLAAEAQKTSFAMSAFDRKQTIPEERLAFDPNGH